ncbi:MAG: phospholipid carrier-dependent glycosyltransferase [Chloroflexota bacterium]
MSKLWRVTAVFILLLAFWLMVGSAVQKSPTVDEQSKLFRGAAYLNDNATQFLLGHPLLGSSVAALGTFIEPNLNTGVDQPFWETGNWSIAGNAFMWQLNPDPHRLIFLGRLPIIFAALLLGSLIFRWAKQMGTPVTGVIAMALLLLDPNFIAHGRLVTGDLLLTAFFVLTFYGFWLIYQKERQPVAGILMAGLGVGLASTTKFNAALLLPILTVLTLLICYQRKRWRPLLNLLLIVGVGGLVIVSFYRFNLRPLPGGAFWDDLFWVLNYFAADHGAYLFEQTSPTGWWYYFPVAFFLKTPLPTQILLLFSLIMKINNLRLTNYKSLNHPITQSPSNPVTQLSISNHQTAILLIPPILYLIFAMSSSLNIGYRHLLPMLPFLFLFTAVTLTARASKSVQIARSSLIIWLAALSIWVFPNYIPFFNLAAGGSANGWRLLSDSNVDWGQDLPELARWQHENQVDTLFLSYFGTAHPSAYGIDFNHIPTWAPTPEQTQPERQAYAPYNPAPGIYAISVNHLHGVVLGEARGFYAFFRDKEPIKKIGNSIFIYEVEPNGNPVDIVFSGIRPSMLEDALQFESNDLQIRWVDTNSAFLWPGNGGWLLVDHESEMSNRFLTETAVQTLANQRQYLLPAPPQLAWMNNPQTLDNQITYLGTTVLNINATNIELMTAWRSEKQIEEPMQIFVHALNEQDEIIGQWDGVHSDVTSWSSGDVFVQFHSFAISDEAELQKLATGFYNPANGVRLGEQITTFIK